MCLKIFNNERHINKESFKEIFRDHWPDFKKKYCRYNTKYYEVIVKKMLNCGEVLSGYSLYVCGNCGISEKK